MISANSTGSRTARSGCQLTTTLVRQAQRLECTSLLVPSVPTLWGSDVAGLVNSFPFLPPLPRVGCRCCSRRHRGTSSDHGRHESDAHVWTSSPLLPRWLRAFTTSTFGPPAIGAKCEGLGLALFRLSYD